MSIVKAIYKLSETENENEIPKEVQLLKVGKFEHFYFGEFEINEISLSEMKKNYDKKVRGIDLAIDVAHQNHLDAAGWFKKLTIKNGEMWATIDWNDLGIDKIGKKRFRYLSAEFDTDYEKVEFNKAGVKKVKKLGKVLLGAALTNRPFLKNMEPTTKLSEEKVKMEQKVKELTESNDSLGAENKKLSEGNKELSEKNEVLSKEISTLKEEKILSEKEVTFQKMLDEGKAIPAQKDAWIKGDLNDFAAKATNVKVNLNENGSGEGNGETGKAKEKNEDDLNKEAIKLADKDSISLSDAQSNLLDTDEFKHLNK